VVRTIVAGRTDNALDGFAILTRSSRRSHRRQLGAVFGNPSEFGRCHSFGRVGQHVHPVMRGRPISQRGRQFGDPFARVLAVADFDRVVQRRFRRRRQLGFREDRWLVDRQLVEPGQQ